MRESSTHIAVVEDDTDLRNTIREVHEEDGYVVTGLSDGEKLLGLLGHRQPDLVVLDLGLPGVGGLDVLSLDGLEIDLTTRDATVDGAHVTLTAKEFDLLAFLASSPPQVFSKEALLDRVWGSSPEWQDTATVSEHIHSPPEARIR